MVINPKLSLRDNLALNMAEANKMRVEGTRNGSVKCKWYYAGVFNTLQEVVDMLDKEAAAIENPQPAAKVTII